MPVPKSKKSAAKKSSKPAREPKEPRVKKEGVLCHCGCGEMTKPGRLFLQGHDARFKGRAVKIADGRLEWSDVEKEIEDYAVPFYKEAIKEAKANGVAPKTVKKKVAAKAKPAAKAKVKVKQTAKPKTEAASHDESNPSDGGGE